MEGRIQPMDANYKCQLYDEDSFIDSMFITFVQSYLVNVVQKYADENGFDSQNKPTILEVGCYNGRLRTFITQNRCFIDYIGVDVRKDYIDNHRVGNRKSVKMLNEDVTQGLSIDDNSVHIAVSSEVLEHITSEKWPALLRNVHAKLRPGGMFVVGFPMNTSDTKYHDPMRETSLGHVNFPVHDEFIKLAEDCGYKFEKFDSIYSVKSSYRMPPEMKNSEVYKKVRSRLGAQIARAVAMTLEDGHTGGGFYTLRKPADQ
jgi:SAM-dependent methyltransferase